MINGNRNKKIPVSLQLKKSLRSDDILDSLYSISKGKCYLCEKPEQPRSFEVDHRHPKSAGGDEYDWNNLYPACKNCNSRRNKNEWPEEGLLHPDGRDDVEELLEQWLDENLDPHFIAKSSENLAAINTATELQKLHTNDGKKGYDLLSAIKVQYGIVADRINKLLKLRSEEGRDCIECRKLEEEIRIRVNRFAPYSMLIRSRAKEYIGDLLD